ncbi:efflux RND transporter periplasmic adaptor subunit [Craterilacuibacter sinensis]|uniref:Efflux RND transporter periplasmic adaptor subunit n=1 Tax=Craterilacuibacter sinensis TaxID=2686017 RepID=A0A845BPS8_9NEIS|nr:efflux RND transporter periplasmic adaptor subunit [Craterilacuibacter sinensis]MXR36481.1 efflux RND transporter periplasmic adaptor subunit [Craterilacuibacter sinensis]
MKLLVPLLALCLLAACSGGESSASARKGPPPVAISSTVLAVQPLSETVRAWAEVESAVAPEVAAEVSGRVARVLVDVGQQVKAGQALAEIEPGNLNDARLAAEAEAARYQALLAEQQATVSRNQALVKQGFISAAALDASMSQRDALQKQLAAAQAQASSKGRDAARAVIRAPVGGVVEARAISAGDYVNPGKVAFSLNASGSRRVRLALGGAAGDRLQRGMEVALGNGTHQLKTQISEVRAGLDAASRARIAWADLPADAPWRVGDALDAEISLAQRSALALPAQAVIERPAGKVVYVVVADKAEERKVVTGMVSGDRIEILSGLKAGDKVVVDGAGFLSDGAAVRDAAARGKPGAKGAGA